MADETYYPGYDRAFEMLDTYGLPLEIAMDECEKHGIRVDLVAFMQKAVRANWGFDKALGTVQEALNVKYGSKVAEVVISELKTGLAFHWKELWPELDKEHLG